MRKFTAFLLVFILFSCTGERKDTSVDNAASDTIIEIAPAVRLQTDHFAETVYKVIKAFESKDQRVIDSLTSPQYGAVVIYRIGAYNEYKLVDKISLSKPVPEIYPYPVFSSNFRLQYATLPNFDCGEMKWDKHGLYSDTIAKNTLLSDTPMYLNKYRGDTIPEGDIKFLKDLESKSRRIILAGKNDRNLIFHLTLIDGKWYLTVIDRITGDCSA